MEPSRPPEWLTATFEVELSPVSAGGARRVIVFDYIFFSGNSNLLNQDRTTDRTGTDRTEQPKNRGARGLRTGSGVGRRGAFSVISTRLT